MYEGETKLAPNKVYFLIEGDDDIPLTYLSAVASGTEDLEVGSTALEVGTVYFKYDEGGGEDSTTVTFSIEGQSFTVAQGTIWGDWIEEVGMDFLYLIGDEVKRVEDDAPLLDPSGKPVFFFHEIVSGEYGFGSTEVFFEITDSGETRFYVVENGTTWEEWAKTTYDSEMGGYEWCVNEYDGSLYNNWSGGVLADMEGNLVSAWDSIISGEYQRMD